MGSFGDHMLSETDAKLFKPTVAFIIHNEKAARISGNKLETVCYIGQKQ